MLEAVPTRTVCQLFKVGLEPAFEGTLAQRLLDASPQAREESVAFFVDFLSSTSARVRAVRAKPCACLDAVCWRVVRRFLVPRGPEC